MITQERTLTGVTCAIRTAKTKKYNVKLCQSFDMSTARMPDGSSSSTALIAQTKYSDCCVCSVSAQLQHDDEKSCSDHASEHQDRHDVDRDELLDLELHVWLHLHTPAAWRRSTPNRAISSSCVEGAATLSTVEALGQLQLGIGGSKTALKKL